MKIKHALLAASLLAASATASAGEFWTYVPGVGNLLNAGANQPFVGVSVNGATSAGQFQGNFWSGPQNPRPSDSFFRFFCAELRAPASAGPNSYLSSTFADVELAKLYDVAYPNKNAGDFWSSGAATNFGQFFAGGGYTASELAAAFQVALWEILIDNSIDLANGSFRWTGASSNVKSAADAMLAAVVGYNPTSLSYAKWTLFKFQQPIPNCTGGDCTNLQDYVSATYDAPEPGTLALFGFTLAGFGLMARRRRT